MRTLAFDSTDEGKETLLLARKITLIMTRGGKRGRQPTPLPSVQVTVTVPEPPSSTSKEPGGEAVAAESASATAVR